MHENTVEDLRAFERRFQEILAGYRPSAKRFQAMLFAFFAATMGLGVRYLYDVYNTGCTFEEALPRHSSFLVALIFFLTLIAFKSYQLARAPAIIVARTREIFQDYGLFVSDDGRLLLQRLERR